MRRCAAFVVLTALSASPAFSQVARVSGSTHIRYIELRPLVADSVALGDAPGEGLMRQTVDGRVVRCIPSAAFCRDLRPGERVSTVPVIHDLEVTAWGFGRGAYVYAQLRGRTAWGGGELWPRGDDAFDVLAAYADIARGRLRMRAGRQWKVSGLGFYNFDGLALETRVHSAATVEAYAGRSLLRGLNEPRAGGALESIEALAPPAAGLLMGLHARYQHKRTFALSAVYQVDFRDDGGGLFSELAAADAVVRVAGVSVEGALELDVASAALNEARVRVHSPPLGRFTLNGELRRYRPYFELWTIWGAFSPVGFDEARAGVTWSDTRGRLIVQSEASYRTYDVEELEQSLGDFRDSGWGIAGSINWLPARAWRVGGGYRVETGFGAARREGNVSVTRDFDERASVGVQALAFERLFEFRLEEGTVVGLGAEASLKLSERARIFAAGTTYRHLHDGLIAGTDWNQRRASMRLQWTIGPEPGMSAVQP